MGYGEEADRLAPLAGTGWWRQLLVWDTGSEGRWEKDAEVDFDASVTESERGLPRHEVTAARAVTSRHQGDFYWTAMDEKSGLFRVWNGQIWEGEANAGRIYAWLYEFWTQYREALSTLEEDIVSAVAEKKAALIDAGHTESAARKTAEEDIGKPMLAKLKEHREFYKKMGNATGRSNVVRELSVDPRIIHRESEFDTQVGIIVTSNCVLSLGALADRVRGGSPWVIEPQPHDKERLVTQRMDVTYQDGVRAEMWERYWEQVLPNPAVRWHVQKLLGSALLGDPVSRLLLNFIGPPASGKSVAINVLNEFFGDYGYFAPAVIFQEDKFAGAENPSPAFDDMRKRKLVVSSEANARKPYNTAVLKGLTGRDTQRSRGMHVSGGPWKPRMLIVIATNEFIRFDINDDAFAKRVHPIEFPMRFRKPGPGETWEDIPKEEQDDDTLQSKILASETERTGILNWLLEGLRGYATEGVAEPAEIGAHRTVMKTTLNSAHAWFQQFLSDGQIIQFPPGSKNLPKLYSLGVKEAYYAYEDWCRDEGVEKDDMFNQQQFKRSLRQDGLHRPDTGFRRRSAEVVGVDGTVATNTDVFDRLAWSDWQVRYGVTGH